MCIAAGCGGSISAVVFCESADDEAGVAQAPKQRFQRMREGPGLQQRLSGRPGRDRPHDWTVVSEAWGQPVTPVVAMVGMPEPHVHWVPVFGAVKPARTQA